MRLLLFFWCSFFLQTIHRCFNFAQFRRVAFNNLALLAFLHVDICSRRRFVLDYSPQNRWRITYMRTQTVIYVIIASITQRSNDIDQQHCTIPYNYRYPSATIQVVNLFHKTHLQLLSSHMYDTRAIRWAHNPLNWNLTHPSTSHQHSNPIRSLFTLIVKSHKSVTSQVQCREKLTSTKK